jgi:hypothetical protein
VKRVNEEMIKMAEEENFFQIIAEDLNLSMDRVQFYWKNWMCKQETVPENLEQNQPKFQDQISSQANPLGNDDVPQIHGEMQAKLITPRKVIFFWDSSYLPKQFFQLYFNICFDELVQVIRIYDVTKIEFNGKNAHHLYDIPIPYQQGYWIVKGLFSNRSYLAEIGVKLSNNDFFPVLRSNSIRMPKLETVMNHEIHQDLSQFYRHEEQQPKWREFVSTYSYYLENGNDGGKNDPRSYE